MVVITTGRTLDIKYDVKALFSEWAIHRFLYKVSSLKTMQVQSVSWILAEFCYNRSPQGPYTGTCTILQETINGFLCPLIVFRKM